MTHLNQDTIGGYLKKESKDTEKLQMFMITKPGIAPHF